MLSNGRSKDNTHIGSTRIIAGDLEVDGGTLIEGDLTVNGTINGGTGLVDQRVAISRWFTQQQSLLNFSAYTGIFLNSNTGDSTTIGNNVIPASDFTITDENYSILHVQFILRVNTTDIVQPNQFQVRLRLDDGVSQGTIEFEVMELTGTIQTESERIMDVYLTFIRNPADPTKINISNQTLKHTNAVSITAPTATNDDKLFLSNNQFKIGSQTGDISMLLPTTKGYFCQFNNYATGRPLTITMACQRPNPNAFNTIDYGVLMGQLITYKKQSLSSGGTPLNDHLLLTNLNGGTGDGGHINLFDRRGIKPMTGNIDMNNNSIINNSLIQTDQIQTDLITTQSGGITLPIIADTRLLLTENNLPSGEYMEFTPTESKSYKNLNMNNNNIDNVNQVSSSGLLNLQGALGNRVDIGVGGSGRMEIENSRIFISNFADLNIHGQVIWVRPNVMPTLFNPDTTYIFVGSRNTSNSYTLPSNVKIMGTGKNNSIINFNGGGTLFSSVDNNLDVANITLTSSNNTGKLFDLSNVAQDKTINMTQLQIRNTKNGMTIDGYDLIDFNNCIFTYFESGSPTPIGVSITNASKVQLSSCEFLRWFQEGGTPATTFFNGDMLAFGGTLNALNLNGCFFHPQYDQNGINTTFVSSTIEGTITSNTFIDINLNTPAFQVLVVNPTTVAPNYIIESNSIYPNLKSQVTYVLSAVNTTATDLSTTNPNVINHNNLALPLSIQFATIGTNGLITYTKKRSANFLITATCNLELVAGTNNRIGLGLFVNSAAVPLAYSYVNLSAAGSANQKSATLSFTGTAIQGDTFQLSVFNTTANNNVIVNDVNFAGIEI